MYIMFNGRVLVRLIRRGGKGNQGIENPKILP